MRWRQLSRGAWQAAVSGPRCRFVHDSLPVPRRRVAGASPNVHLPRSRPRPPAGVRCGRRPRRCSCRSASVLRVAFCACAPCVRGRGPSHTADAAPRPLRTPDACANRTGMRTLGCCSEPRRGCRPPEAGRGLNCAGGHYSGGALVEFHFLKYVCNAAVRCSHAPQIRPAKPWR